MKLISIYKECNQCEYEVVKEITTWVIDSDIPRYRLIAKCFYHGHEELYLDKLLDSIDDIELEYDSKDYPDFCDTYASSGTYKDGKDITDKDLDLINTKANDYLYEELIKRLW